MVRAVTLCSCLLYAGLVWGDTIVVSSAQSGQWVTWTSAGNNGGEFWDNRSSDGVNCNIGHVLTGAATAAGCNNEIGVLPLSPIPGPMPFLAANAVGSAAVGDFYFLPGTPHHSVQLMVEVAGFANGNQLGVYFLNNAATAIEAQNVLFLGPASAPAATSFTAGRPFGFYLVVNGGSTTYFTQSSMNSSDRNQQHFAVFRERPAGTGDGLRADEYWLGIEDLPIGSGDKDYQDMVVRVRAVPVPEPGAWLLLGTLLIGLVARAVPRHRG